MKPPQPTKKVACLPSAGYDYMRATKHVYIGTRPCTIPGPGGEAWEHIFKCELTGETRRWGVERRTEIVN